MCIDTLKDRKQSIIIYGHNIYDREGERETSNRKPQREMTGDRSKGREILTHTETIDSMCYAKCLRTETGVKISSVLYWRGVEL